MSQRLNSSSLVGARRSSRPRRGPLSSYSEIKSMLNEKSARAATTVSTRLRSRDVHHDRASLSLPKQDDSDSETEWFDAPSSPASGEGSIGAAHESIFSESRLANNESTENSCQEQEAIELSSSDEEYVDANEPSLDRRETRRSRMNITNKRHKPEQRNRPRRRIQEGKRGLPVNDEHWKMRSETARQQPRRQLDHRRRNKPRRRSLGETDSLIRLSSLVETARVNNVASGSSNPRPIKRRRRASKSESVLTLSAERVGRMNLRKRVDTSYNDPSVSSSSSDSDFSSASSDDIKAVVATIKGKVAQSAAPVNQKTWVCLKCSKEWPETRSRCPPPCSAWPGGKRKNLYSKTPKFSSPSRRSPQCRKRKREAEADVQPGKRKKVSSPQIRRRKPEHAKLHPKDEEVSDATRTSYDAPGADEEEELGRSLKAATVPKFHSTNWKIWTRLEKSFVTASKTGQDASPRDAALTIQASAEHNFGLVHTTICTKMAAGMYRAALKYCNDVIRAWYKEAQHAIGLQLCGRGNNDELRSIDSVRTGLAGMWCIYAHLLIELSSLAGNVKTASVLRRPKTNRVSTARTVSTRGTDVSFDEKRNGESKNVEADLPISEADIADYALSLIRNAAFCPIVGNHPWIAIAHSRMLLTCFADSQGEIQLEKLRSSLASAIKVCKNGIFNSTPLPYLVKARNDTLESLDSNRIVAFVSQHLPTHGVIDDIVTSSQLKDSFLSVNRVVPRLLSATSKRSRYFFVDPRGARVLCNEVNRLSRFQEKVQKAVSVRLSTPPDDSGCVARNYGLQGLVRFRAVDVDLDKSVFPEQPNEWECSAHSKSKRIVMSSTARNRVEDIDMESSSESTPVLIASDNDEDAKRDCPEKRIKNPVKPTTKVHESVGVTAVSGCDLERTEGSRSGGPGSLCSMVESPSPVNVPKAQKEAFGGDNSPARDCVLNRLMLMKAYRSP